MTAIEAKGANLLMALVDDGFKLIVKSQEQIPLLTPLTVSAYHSGCILLTLHPSANPSRV